MNIIKKKEAKHVAKHFQLNKKSKKIRRQTTIAQMGNTYKFMKKVFNNHSLTQYKKRITTLKMNLPQSIQWLHK